MKGTIYKITCKLTSKYYIGSTIHTLKYRLKKHRSTSKEPDKMNSPFYTHFRSVGWHHADIQAMYEVDFETRKQLLQIEKEEIVKHLNNELCLNRNRPCISREEKKEHDAEYGKKRRAEQKEKERQRVAEWRMDNPEKYAAQLQRSVERQRAKRIEAKNNVENNTN